MKRMTTLVILALITLALALPVPMASAQAQQVFPRRNRVVGSETSAPIAVAANQRQVLDIDSAAYNDPAAGISITVEASFDGGQTWMVTDGPMITWGAPARITKGPQNPRLIVSPYGMAAQVRYTLAVVGGNVNCGMTADLLP